MQSKKKLLLGPSKEKESQKRQELALTSRTEQYTTIELMSRNNQVINIFKYADGSDGVVIGGQTFTEC